LPFEEQCLRFHENERLVQTLSADQVSRPLYRTAVGHWRHFEQWLDPLKLSLGYVLDTYPQVPKFYSGVHAESKSPRSLGPASRRFSFVKGVRQVAFETEPQPSPGVRPTTRSILLPKPGGICFRPCEIVL
jgi:hypothetical protein